MGLSADEVESEEFTVGCGDGGSEGFVETDGLGVGVLFGVGVGDRVGIGVGIGLATGFSIAYLAALIIMLLVLSVVQVFIRPSWSTPSSNPL